MQFGFLVMADTNEIGFFNEFLGEPSEARIGILKPVEGTNPPQYTLVRQSPLEVLNPYSARPRSSPSSTR